MSLKSRYARRLAGYVSRSSLLTRGFGELVLGRLRELVDSHVRRRFAADHRQKRESRIVTATLMRGRLSALSDNKEFLNGCPPLKLQQPMAVVGVGATNGFSIGGCATFDRETRQITAYRSALDAGVP
jgi:hypothetical protein